MIVTFIGMRKDNGELVEGRWCEKDLISPVSDGGHTIAENHLTGSMVVPVVRIFPQSVRLNVNFSDDEIPLMLGLSNEIIAACIGRMEALKNGENSSGKDERIPEAPKLNSSGHGQNV